MLKHIKNHPLFWPTKLFLKRLAKKELWVRTEVDINTTMYGGWEFCPDFIADDSIIYSLGVGNDIEFDVLLIQNFQSLVHAFDPTPYAMEWIDNQILPNNFKFHPWAVSGKNGILRMYQRVNRKGQQSRVMWTAVTDQLDDVDAIEAEKYSLQTIMDKLGNKKIDLLKMDVEGSEYEIIDTILDMKFKPSQLLVEFHHRFSGIGLKKTVNAISNLREVGYKIFAVSKTGREISFIYKA